ATSGSGSTTRKKQWWGELLARATADEQQFLRRLIVGELRQGALEGILTEAIAAAARVEAAAVRRAAMLCGDLGPVAEAALREGESALARFDLTVGRPLAPMLAQTASEPEDALAELGGEALFEVKLDGARVQVHREGNDVAVFTRGLHEVTAAVPEVVEAVVGLPGRSLVLDGEVIALKEDGSPHSFQTTMRRFGRKQNEEKLRAQYPLSPFFFDILRHDGETVIDEPLSARIFRMASALPADVLIERRRTTDAVEADAFLDDVLRRGHEGVMAKGLSSTYIAGNRGAEWRKIKPAHTLDLVVLAVEWGSGRRKGWLSNLHLGAYDPATDGFVMLGKTFKGMTDAMLTWQTDHLLGLEIGREGHIVHTRPELVVEIAFSDLLDSPHYPGGLALRFARVKRYRPDKAASAADTMDTVRRIHQKGHRGGRRRKGA
ncbi:MAG: ATP-dependent DNA ligase, partial [Myxococcota bacterium]